MKSELSASIEQFFVDHDGDGEFPIQDFFSATPINEPPGEDGWIVYSTKRHSMRAILSEPGASNRFAAITVHGLPLDSHLAELVELVAGRRLLFLGDLDPVDLLTFAWLRENLKPLQIEYAGISDHFVAQLRIPFEQIPSIRLSPSEEEATKLMENVLPDFESLVGPMSVKLLKEKRKIEIEAIISAANRSLPVYLGFCDMTN